MSNKIGDTYLNLTGQNYKPTGDAAEKRKFSDDVDKAAEEIIDMIPGLLENIIDEKAAEINIPACLQVPDPVTRDKFDAAVVRKFLAGKISNKLSRSLRWLDDK